jgi:hypothetical protein
MKKILQLCALTSALILLAVISVSLTSTHASASRVKAAAATPAAAPAATISLPVTVTNANTNPVFVEDVDNPARQPLAINLCNASDSGTVCGGVPNFFTLPAGQRYVIEQVSGQCLTTDPGNIAVANINATVNGTGARTSLPDLPSAALGSGFIIPATMTRIYPDAGTELSLELGPGQVSSSPGLICNVTLIGHTTRP